MEKNIVHDLKSDCKVKKRMNTKDDYHPVGDYDPKLTKLTGSIYTYSKNMLNQKYIDVIKQSNLVTNFSRNQIVGYLMNYKKNLKELIGETPPKYKLVGNDNKSIDLITKLNEFIKWKREFDPSKVILDPKFYPKRSNIDMVKLKKMLDTTGMEGTSLRKLATENNVSVGTMHKVVNQILGYSYRSVNPLNVKAVNQANMNSILLFMLRHSLLVEEDSRFIYMDESSFNNHKRAKKRWIHKRRITYCYDFGRVESLSLTLAISNTEVLLSHYKRRSNKSVDTQRFITELVDTVSTHHRYGSLYEKKKIALILDNAKIHKTNEMKDLLISTDFKVLFLPPYTPQFNPVELAFNFLKRNFYRLSFTCM